MIDERFYTIKEPNIGTYDGVPIVTEGMLTRTTGTWLVNINSNVAIYRKAEVTAMAKYKGNNTWHDHRHFDVSWNQQATYSKMR